VAARDVSLRVEQVEVGPERVEAVVRVVDERHMRTSSSPGVSRRTTAALPGIVRHRCECGASHGIERELADTETPHLLEHVALELMVLAGSPRTLRGDTRWDFARDGRGAFRVALDYDHDLVALAALKEGARLVDTLLAGDRIPDIEPIVEGLRALRATGAE
jgi:hypothetical protein